MVATGSRPILQDENCRGLELALTSDDVFSLRAKPVKSLVIGGGFVASELASFLQGLGCQVTLVAKAPILKCRRD